MTGPETCWNCDGRGRMRVNALHGHSALVACDACGGTGGPAVRGRFRLHAKLVGELRYGIERFEPVDAWLARLNEAVAWARAQGMKVE